MAKRVLALTICLTLVFALAGLARSGVTVGGDAMMEYSWGSYDDDWADYDGYVALHEIDNVSTRLKVKYTSDDKKFGAYFEIGVYGLADNDKVTTRKANFWYSWDGGAVLFGQDYSVCDRYWPRQKLNDAAGLKKWGVHEIGRVGQFRLTLGKQHQFMLGLEYPKTKDAWGDTGEVYNTLPAIALAASINAGKIVIYPYVRYENTQWQDAVDTDSYYSLDVGGYLNGSFGLVGCTLGLNYGINSGDKNVVVTNLPLVINGQVEDNVCHLQTWGELRIGGLAMGYSRITGQRDDWAETAYAQGVFANYKIPYGQINFQPEIVWLDNGEDNNGNDKGSATIFGLYCNLKF